MHQISATPFLLFFIFPIVHSKKGCSDSFCGNKTLPIRYPFQLLGQNQKDCNYIALNLTCSDAQLGVPLLNLPSFGDLYARNINYSANVIQLYPTNTYNCLASRFLSTGISYSPLSAVSYQNYTFFSCPRGNLSSSNFTAIGCLSNATFSVLATSSISRAEEIDSLGCSVMVTVPIPVSTPLQYEFNGFDDDLILKWNVTTCEACVKKKRHGAGYVVLIVFLSLVLPNVFGFLLYVLVVALIYFIRWIRNIIRWVADRVSCLARAVRNRNQRRFPVRRAPPPPPSNVTAGSGNDAAANRFKTILLGESRRIPGPNGTTCPICLEEYNPTETVKSIIECGHCFHDSCIDQWLRTHSSCPICRNATV
ncbi:putative RING-H2 finger protein ATL21A [Primulina huaijiensis]|uniref:putative RING-H2 finger protein ATL21A n=1 Tax=Primulina huaijiensis TaxID=1492673 RepID=UPI003CC70C97